MLIRTNCNGRRIRQAGTMRLLLRWMPTVQKRKSRRLQPIWSPAPLIVFECRAWMLQDVTETLDQNSCLIQSRWGAPPNKIVMKACVLKYSNRWTSRCLKIEAEKAWPIMWHLLLVPLTDRSTSHCSLRSQSQSTVVEQENILVLSDGQSDYITHISKSTWCSHSSAKMKYYKMMCFEGEHELQRLGCCIDLLHRLSHSFAWIIKAKEKQKEKTQ